MGFKLLLNQNFNTSKFLKFLFAWRVNLAYHFCMIFKGKELHVCMTKKVDNFYVKVVQFIFSFHLDLLLQVDGLLTISAVSSRNDKWGVGTVFTITTNVLHTEERSNWSIKIAVRWFDYSFWLRDVWCISLS